MILRDLAPALRSLLVVSIAVLGPSCKRGAHERGDASAEGGALLGEGGTAGLADAAPSAREAGSGELQQDAPSTPVTAPLGDLLCIGRAVGGKATSTAGHRAPPPPPPSLPRGRGAAPAPTARPKHALEIDHPIEFKVLHRNMCFAGACSTAPATCTATRQGFNIRIDTRVPSPSTPPVIPCTTECSPALAKCQSDSLPAGHYTVELDGRRHFVQIPSLAPPPCAN